MRTRTRVSAWRGKVSAVKGHSDHAENSAHGGKTWARTSQ